jgi:hypothetical protein
MLDRRSQRIRDNFKQRPNPRSRAPVEALPFAEQIRRVYASPATTHQPAVDQHAALARLLSQRRGRR